VTKKISVCIPAYNRARFLVPLLDSIRAQTVQPDEVVICEDVSPERDAISQIVKDYQVMYPAFPLKLFLNEVNLGYDKNFKMLLNSSTGDYCFFMGNDDLIVPEAIEKVAKAVEYHPNVAVLSRAYQWFLNDELNIQDTVRHLSEDELFEPGVEAVRFFYRRMGVLSGLVIDRKKAVAIETDEFDGHLYYQMYLAGKLLQSNQGYYIASVQTLSRDGINPDFGNAKDEKAKFSPGSFQSEGRVHMVEGLLKIARCIDSTDDLRYFKVIKSDIAIYFYPYIRDQLNLSLFSYVRMIKTFATMGLKDEPYFYVHSVLGFLFKKKGYDFLIKILRKLLGRSPRLGI
jgi:glycosyltransferase involved in cell wall biosynthesis